MSDQTIDKNTKTAIALIELGCVVKTETGFEVRMPVMRNQNPVIFTVIPNDKGLMVCDCFTFLDCKTCAHAVAAKRLAAEVSRVLPFTAILEFGNRKRLDWKKTEKFASKIAAVEWLKIEAANKFQPEGMVLDTFGDIVFEITDEYFLTWAEAA